MAAAKVAAPLPFGRDPRAGAFRALAGRRRRPATGAAAALYGSSAGRAVGPCAAWGRRRRSRGTARAEEEEERAEGKDQMGGEEEAELEDDDFSCFRGLVLDITYRPVHIVCWKRAICLEFMEKADVLEYYDQTVSSAGGSLFYIPAVLRVPQLLQVVKKRRVRHNLSRKNILYRDSFTCQYCASREDLTIDHVVPTSRGGEWTWENLVTACGKCNSRKGRKTVEEAAMSLLKTPKAPKDYDLLAVPLTQSAFNMLRKRKGLPEEWLQYLGMATP